MNAGGQSDVGCAANLSISMFYETDMHIVGSPFTSRRFFPDPRELDTPFTPPRF